MNVFDIVNNITQKTTKFDWADIKSVYTPYVVNKALSFDRRTVHYANMMNMHHALDPEMQMAFYGVVDKIQRPGRWIKSTKVDEAPIVAKHFSCGLQEALQLIKLMPQEQLNEILTKYNKAQSG